MRPSQQKNRMRGRGRKQPNPLSRNYESNGPDVKIRGNASHIADKYAALARDAASSGDPVMAENYLQHAEHYNRIIAAATAAASRNEEQAQNAKSSQSDPSEDDQPSTDSHSGGDNSRGSGDRRGDEQAARGDGGGENAADSQDKPRRRRKARKPDANSDSEAPNGDARPERNSASEAGQERSMTDDAAKLPGSLIGASGGESEVEAGSTGKD